ncbi:hypothetical protein BDV93DRAFT_261158 [Ceratobasidium sp. AG-I]|nr:hypothetical protein BDV93DRAFT_261158 [Ceratobasidium sp. AG-I]
MSGFRIKSEHPSQSTQSLGSAKSLRSRRPGCAPFRGGSWLPSGSTVDSSHGPRRRATRSRRVLRRQLGGADGTKPKGGTQA